MTTQELIDGLRASAQYWKGTDSPLYPLMIGSAECMGDLSSELEGANQVLNLIAARLETCGDKLWAREIEREISAIYTKP